MPFSMTSYLLPSSGGVPFLLEDVHLRGGFRVVADAAARDAIPVASRKSGMLVFVQSSAKFYRYSGSSFDETDIVNPSVPTPEEAKAGADNTKMMTALRTKEFVSQYGLGVGSQNISNFDDPGTGFRLISTSSGIPNEPRVGLGGAWSGTSWMSDTQQSAVQVFTNNNTNRSFFRSKSAGVWLTWNELTHSGNLSGSTLTVAPGTAAVTLKSNNGAASEGTGQTLSIYPNTNGATGNGMTLSHSSNNASGASTTRNRIRMHDTGVRIEDGNGNVLLELLNAGQMLLGPSTSSGYKLDVTGSSRVDGNLHVGTGSNSRYVVVDGGTNNDKGMICRVGGSNRWFVGANSTLEDAGNVGSDLGIMRYDNSGNVLGTAVSIARATGNVVVNRSGDNGVDRVQVGGSLLVDGTLKNLSTDTGTVFSSINTTPAVDVAQFFIRNNGGSVELGNARSDSNHHLGFFSKNIERLRLGDTNISYSPISMNNNKITSVADPTNPTDAVNLQTLQNFVFDGGTF